MQKEQPYEVRVHVIEARDLLPRDGNGMSDPVCYVTAFGKTQKTKVHNKTTNVTFDRWFIFKSKHEITPEALAREKLKFVVYDANVILRNTQIGSHVIDMGHVHKQKGHEIFAKWLVLADKKHEGVQGYLKITAVVLGPGDLPLPHDEGEEFQDEQHGDSLQSMLLVPPSLAVEDWTLSIKCHEATFLPKTDLSKSDPYLSVHFGGNRLRTHHKKKTLSPVWNEELLFPFVRPTMSDAIKIELWDDDTLRRDDYVACIFYSLKDLIDKAKNPGLHWCNIYYDPDEKKLVQADSSLCRGMMLLDLKVIKRQTKKPNVKPCSGPARPADIRYSLLVDVFEAANIPSNEKIFVSAQIGNAGTIVTSKQMPTRNGTSRFFEQLNPLNISLPQKKESLPDIFIHVTKKKQKRIGYVRVKPTDLTTQGEPKWYELEPDPWTKYKEHKVPGNILIRLSFGLHNEVSSHNRPSADPLKLIPYEIRAHVYQAKNLSPKDTNGSSDPFVSVQMGKVKTRTSIKEDTLFPLWYETNVLNVELPTDLSHAPLVTVKVWDDDPLGDDFIGRIEVPVTQMSPEYQKKPKWYTLTSGKGAFEGEILLGFQLIPKDSSSKYPVVDIKPELIDCVVEVDVVSIRELVHYASLPCNKPYLRLTIGDEQKKGSKNPLGLALPNILKKKSMKCSHVQSRVPQSKSSGNSCEVLQTLVLECRLPKDPLFAPSLNFKMFDSRKLQVDPVVGYTSVSLGEYCPWNPNQEHQNTHVDQNKGKIVKIEVPPDKDAFQEAAEAAEAMPRPVQLDIPSFNVVKPGASEDTPLLVTGEETNLETVIDSLESREADIPPAELNIDEIEGEVNDEDQVELDDGAGVPGLPRAEDGTILEEGEDEIKIGDGKRIRTGALERKITPRFEEFDLFREQILLKQWFVDKNSRLVEAGIVKASVNVHQKETWKPGHDVSQLLQPETVKVRIYILRGLGLVPADKNGKADPYVVIDNGTKGGFPNINDIQKVQLETLFPSFYECYEFSMTMPDKSGRVHVSLWDHDPGKFETDDLIGTTVIDLGDRWYSKEWRALKKKPIERRPLFIDTSKCAQGLLELWVDILTTEEASRTPIEDIKPPGPQQWQLRMCIWDAHDVPAMDNFGSSDVYVLGKMHGQKAQTTDTNWFSKDGKCYWNWRMVWNVTVPQKISRWTVQVWDKDVFNPDDAIAEGVIDFGGFFKKAFYSKEQKLSLKKQELVLAHSGARNEKRGVLVVSLDLVTAEYAAKNEVGIGRSEPNRDPYLPDPPRPASSFNPFRIDKWFNFGWKKYRCRVITCCIICLVLILAAGLPTLFGFLGFIPGFPSL